jgi:hypothetical protein
MSASGDEPPFDVSDTRPVERAEDDPSPSDFDPDKVPTNPIRHTGRLITVKLRPVCDPNLTCVVCGRPDVDEEFETRVGQSFKAWHGWHGVHRACADLIVGSSGEESASG